jgi:hypothetical protein
MRLGLSRWRSRSASLRLVQGASLPQWLLYPRGAAGGSVRALHRRSPHLEQRSRRVTSASLASQPTKFASAFGNVLRS